MTTMTSDPRDLPSVAPEEATPARQRPSTWRLVRANGAVRVGACALALLTFVALAAPWLGTVDPSAIDPASINIAPGTRAPFTDLAGDARDHLFLLGPTASGATPGAASPTARASRCWWAWRWPCSPCWAAA